MTDFSKLPNPFTTTERQHIDNALTLALNSYRRSQKQRPEFEEIARKLEQEIQQLITKFATWK